MLVSVKRVGIEKDGGEGAPPTVCDHTTLDRKGDPTPERRTPPPQRVVSVGPHTERRRGKASDLGGADDKT